MEGNKQFKDLHELEFKDWDGKPFDALMTDNVDEWLTSNELKICNGEKASYDLRVRVIGYTDGNWVTKEGIHWMHVYPISMNSPQMKRMSLRELSCWLANGMGECTRAGTDMVYNYMNYALGGENDEVDEGIRVREYGKEEWVIPTKDMYHTFVELSIMGGKR